VNNERPLRPTSGALVFRLLGWGNLSLSFLSLSAIFWKILVYREAQTVEAGSAFAYGLSGKFEIGFYLLLIAGAILYLFQAYTGWHLLRGETRVIKTCLAVFSLEIVYFISVWVCAFYLTFDLPIVLRSLIMLEPGIVLDLQMVAGYPAAGIALLWCLERFHLGADGSSAGKTEIVPHG
jgi:hypothetical protein